SHCQEPAENPVLDRRRKSICRERRKIPQNSQVRRGGKMAKSDPGHRRLVVKTDSPARTRPDGKDRCGETIAESRFKGLRSRQDPHSERSRPDGNSYRFPQKTRSQRVSALHRLFLHALSRSALQLGLDAPGDEDHRWVETILLDRRGRPCISLREPNYDEGPRYGLLVYACCIPWVKS